QKRGVGKPFRVEDFHLYLNTNIIITSEKAFQIIPEQFRTTFSTHYFLRNKGNLDELSKLIKVHHIEELVYEQISTFPFIVKPGESSGGKVPFKFKVVRNQEDLKFVEPFILDCICQPFLSCKEYAQIAVGGYFDGTINSLIAVEQVSQYPTGVSAYVIDKTEVLRFIRENIAAYLGE